MAYSPINWQDFPNEETPLSSFNLNHMDLQIKANADKLDTPASTDEIGLVKPDGETISIDEEGTISLTGLSGIATESPITSATGNINAITLYGESRKSKNLLNYSANTQTMSGVTYTVNADKTITINGATPTDANSSFILIPNNNKYKVTENIKVLGCPSGGAETKYRITSDCYKDGVYKTSKVDSGNGFVIDSTLYDEITLNVFVYKNNTVNNLTFKPMLTTDTTLTYADYEQYGIISADGEVECSVNSFDGELMQGFRTADGINTYNRVCETLNYMPCESGNKINVTTEKTFAYIGVTVFNANKTYISSTGATYSNTKSIRNYAIPSNAKYFTVWFQNTSAMTPSQVGEVSIENVKSSINASTICPTYSLYGIDTIKNTLEVYADGSGKFVSKIGSVNLGSLTWNWQSTWLAWYSDMPSNTKKPSSNDNVANVLYVFDAYAENYLTANTSANGVAIATSGRIILRNGSSTDRPSGTLLYELATPTETPLTAEEVAQFLALKTFKGTTNISADCGYKISYYLDNNVAQGIANVDAKVGAINNELSSQIDNGYLYRNLMTSFRQGSLSDSSMASRICSINNGVSVSVGDKIKYSINSAYKVAIIVCSQDTNTGGTVLQDSGWKLGSGEYAITKDGYLRCLIASVSSQNIAPTENTDIFVLNMSESNTGLKKSVDDLTPSAYVSSGLTYTNCAYVGGGYCKVGKLVVVNIRVTASSSALSINGLPSYSNVSSSMIVNASVYGVTEQSAKGGFIRNTGLLELPSVTNGNQYVISSMYLCN